MGGWFFIDFVSIIPLDIILLAFVEDSGNDAQVNRMIKMGKFSKLYKLIKITRLFRLLKLMKNRGKVVKQIGENLQLSESFERLSFFVAVLFMLSHIFGCIWIFIGR